MSVTSRPVVEFDDGARVVTIEGVKYSYEFFTSLGFNGVPIGSALRIIRRSDDGVLTVEQLREVKS